MLRGLWKLTYLETRIFIREPLGLFGNVGVPVLIFIVFGRMFGPAAAARTRDVPAVLSSDLPIFASLLITASTVLSLVSIVAIYREGGILRRLRATPLRPATILTAHVLVKLLFTAVTFVLMVVAGRRFYTVDPGVPILSFTVALLFSTISLLSLGFLIASLVPTARFAQPIGTLFLYPMLALSGLFIPLASLPPVLRLVARAIPFTYAVSLLRGIWHGEGWRAHSLDVIVLAAMFAGFTGLSAWVFRWE